MKGRLEIICGPMFSGKSEELLRRLRRAEIAGKKVVVAKLDFDNRYSENEVISHAGSKMPAVVVRSAYDLWTQCFKYDVIGIDEAQFYDLNSLKVIVNSLKWVGKDVIMSALDMDYRGEPFGPMPYFLCVADKLDKITAICQKCGKEATMTQKLINDKPAPFNGITIEVGGSESYEARCSNCWLPGYDG